MEEQSRKLNDFYQKYITDWMLQSIQVCVDGGASFGAVLLTCCGVEFVGSLCLGEVSKTNNRAYPSNKERFLYFCNNYLVKVSNLYYEYSELIWDVFRNGLAHGYFPAREGGVTSSEENKELHLVIDHSNNRIYIHSELFFLDFKEALKDFFLPDLLSNDSLKKKVIKRIEQLGNEETEAFNKIISGGKSLPTLQVTSSRASVVAIWESDENEDNNPDISEDSSLTASNAPRKF